MRFDCKAKDLNAAIQTVKRAIVTKSTLACLSAVKILADQESQTVGFLGTDLTTVLATQITAAVYEGGEAGANVKEFEAMMPGQTTAEDIITVWNEDYLVFTQQEDFRQSMNEQDISEMPPFPSIEAAQPIVFGDDIKKCLPFASTEETRHFINGVHVAATGTTLDIVATDGKSLKLIQHPYEVEEKQQFGITFDKRASAALKVKFRDELRIGWNEDKIFRIDGKKGTMLYRDTLGEYPDYEAVIAPAKSNMSGAEVEITIDKHDLIGKLERMVEKRWLGKHSTQHVIYFIVQDGMGKMIYKNLEARKMAKDSFQPREIENSEKPMAFALNTCLMHRSLVNIDGPYVTMYVNRDGGKKDGKGLEKHCSLSPVLITPEYFEEDTKDWTVIMPMMWEGETEEDLDFPKPEPEGDEEDGKSDPSSD
jgi:DNA polymerase III sliding clamp (beta) subunit (PCNA family)